MEDELILSEKDRSRLDGIVSKMVANGESDENIQFVVGDFKKKYGAVKKKDESLFGGLQDRQESMEAPAPSTSAKTATPSQQPLRKEEPKSESRKLGISREGIFNSAALSTIQNAVKSGELSEQEISTLGGDPQNLFTRIAENRAKNDTRLSPEVERAQALKQARGPENAAFMDQQIQFAKNKDLNLKTEKYLGAIQEDIKTQVKANVLQAIPEDRREDPVYLKKVEDDIWLEEGIGLDLTGDRRYNDQNPLLDAAAYLSRGVYSLEKGIKNSIGIDVDRFGIPYEVSDKLFDESMRRNTTQFEQDFYDSLKDNDYSNAARIALNTTAESAPIMLATAPMALENPYAAYAVMSSLSAAQTYGDVKDEKWFKELSPMGKAGYTIGTGAFEGIGELAGSRAAARALRGMAVSSSRKASEEALKDFIGGALKRSGVNLSENALGEGITGVGQYVTDGLAKGQEVTLNGAFDAFKRSAASGVGMAALLSAPSAVEAPIFLANKIGRNFEVKKIDTAINKLKDDMLSAPTPQDREVIGRQIIDLQARRDGEMKSSIQYFESMTPEDQNKAYVLSTELENLAQQRVESEDETAKDVLKTQIFDTYNQLKEITNRYDSSQEGQVPSIVGEGETVVEAQPVVGAGQEAPEAGGVLQVSEQEEVILPQFEAEVESVSSLPIFQAMQEGREVDINDANAAQEQIISAISNVAAMPESAEKEAATELLTELFDEIDYYDNKTEITAQDVTERVPVGAPKRVERPKAEKVGKLPLGERLRNAPVRVGDERYGAVSILEEQPDGNVDVVTYRRAALEEIKKGLGDTWADGVQRIESRRITDAFPRITDIEYVESIFDNDGRIMGARVRKRTPLGQDVSPQTFVILNRTEEVAKLSKARESAEDANLALDIAIQGQIEQLGDIPQYDFEQAYETVTRRIETKKKVKAKPRPAAKPSTAMSDVEREAISDIEVAKIGAPVSRLSKKTSAVLDRYLSVLYNVLPDVKMVVHYTQESIDSTLPEDQRTGDVEGYYDDKNGEIHVVVTPTKDSEISKNEFRVIRHEIIHPIVDALVSKDSFFANRLTEEIRKIVETAPDELARTTAMRRMRVILKEGNPKETLTEFLAQFSEPELFDQLDQHPTFFDKVKALINKLLNFLGIKKRIQNKKELLDFLTEMRNSFAAGKAVRIKDGTVVRSALNKYQFSTRQEKQTIVRRFLAEDAEVRIDINDDIVPAKEIQNLNPALSTVLPLIEKLSAKMNLPFVVVNDKKFDYVSKVGFFNFPDLRTGTVVEQMMPVDAVNSFRKKGYNIPKDIKADKFIVINAAAKNVDQAIYGYSAVFIEMLKEQNPSAFSSVMSSVLSKKKGVDPIVNQAVDSYEELDAIAMSDGLYNKMKGNKVYETIELNNKEIREALAYTALADAFQDYIRNSSAEAAAQSSFANNVVDAAKVEFDEQLRPTPMSIGEFNSTSRLDDFANLLSSATEVPSFSQYKAKTLEEAKERIMASLFSKVRSKEFAADADAMLERMTRDDVVYKTGDAPLSELAKLYISGYMNEVNMYSGNVELLYQAFTSPFNPMGYDDSAASFQFLLEEYQGQRANVVNKLASSLAKSNLASLRLGSFITGSELDTPIEELIPYVDEYVDLDTVASIQKALMGEDGAGIALMLAMSPANKSFDLNAYIVHKDVSLSKAMPSNVDAVRADAKEGIVHVRKIGAGSSEDYHRLKFTDSGIVDASTNKAASQEQLLSLGNAIAVAKLNVSKVAFKTFVNPNYVSNDFGYTVFPELREGMRAAISDIGATPGTDVFKAAVSSAGEAGYRIMLSEFSDPEVEIKSYTKDTLNSLANYSEKATKKDDGIKKIYDKIEKEGVVSIDDLRLAVSTMGQGIASRDLYTRTLSFDYTWKVPTLHRGLDVIKEDYKGKEIQDTYTINLTYNPSTKIIGVAYDSKVFGYNNIPPFLSSGTSEIFSRIVNTIPTMFPDIEYAGLDFTAVTDSKDDNIGLYNEYINKLTKLSKSKDEKIAKDAVDLLSKEHKHDKEVSNYRRVQLNNQAYIRKVGQLFSLKVNKDNEVLLSDFEYVDKLGALYAFPYEKYDQLMNSLSQAGFDNLSETEKVNLLQETLDRLNARVILDEAQIRNNSERLNLDPIDYVEQYAKLFQAHSMNGEIIPVPKIFMNLNAPTQFTRSAVQFSKRIKLSPVEESAEDAALDKVAKASYDSDKEYAERMKLFNEKKTSILSKKAWLDRQADIREAMIDGGMQYAENLMTLRAGAQANATDLFNRAEKRIYRDLSRGDIEALDQIIFMRRVIQIDSNWDERKALAEQNLNNFDAKMVVDIKAIDELIKSEKAKSKPDNKFISELENDKMNIRQQREKLKEYADDYAVRPKHPKGLNAEEAIQAITAMERKLGATMFGKLNMRADAYFGEFRNILRTYEQNGLIDKQTFDRFAKDDYEPRKFVEKIFEALDDEVFERSGMGLKQDVLKSIQEGSEGNLLMDSRMLLSLAYKSQEAKRFENIANRELAKEISPDSADFLRKANYATLFDGSIATDQYGNSKVDPADKGFTNVFYKENGKLRAFQLRNDMYVQWQDANRSFFGVGGRAKKILSAMSLSPVLRIFATGYNVFFGFGLVIPESLAIVMARNKIYGKDSLLPVALLKMAKDYAVGIYSKATDQELVRDYFAHGGGMSFMSQEFRPEYRFKEKYKNSFEYALAKRSSQIAKGIAFTGETFEIGIRLAVYSRMISNLKQQYPDLAKTKDGLEKIKFMAAAEARSVVDFSKGGTLTKDLDAVAPYLNVAFQATMSTFNGIKDNPKAFAEKFSQYAIGLMGLVFYNILTYGDDDYEDVDPYMRYRYHIILLPTKDEDGKRQYIRLKKPQQLLPLTVPIEMLAHSWASTINGKPKKFSDEEIKLAWENAADGVPFFVPGVDKAYDLLNRVPAFSAIAKSFLNYDAFRNATVVPEYVFGKVEPYAEGRSSDRVEYFYKAIAKASESEFIPDISAPRLKAGVESIITSPTTNFLVGVAYGVLDLAARATTDALNVDDVDWSDKQLTESVENRATRELKGIKSNATKIFVRSVNPDWPDYVKRAGSEQEIKLDESTEDYAASEKIKALAKKHKEQGRFEKNGKQYQEELNKILSTLPAEKRERIGRKYFYAIASSDKDKSLMSIRFADTPSEAARVFYDKFGKLEPEEFNDVMKDLRETGFRPNEEFYAVIRKLYSQK